MELKSLYYKKEIMAAIKNIMQFSYISGGGSYSDHYMIICENLRKTNDRVSRANLYGTFGLDFKVFETICRERYNKKFKIFGEYQIYEFIGVKRTLEAIDLLCEMMFEYYCMEYIPEEMYTMFKKNLIKRKVTNHGQRSC